MRLNSDGTIVVSNNSNLKLTLMSTNYYLKDTDVAVFTLSTGDSYPCTINDRVYIIADFDVVLDPGTYQYDIAITRDGDKTITILSGGFV